MLLPSIFYGLEKIVRKKSIHIINRIFKNEEIEVIFGELEKDQIDIDIKKATIYLSTPGKQIGDYKEAIYMDAFSVELFKRRFKDRNSYDKCEADIYNACKKRQWGILLMTTHSFSVNIIHDKERQKEYLSLLAGNWDVFFKLGKIYNHQSLENSNIWETDSSYKTFMYQLGVPLEEFKPKKPLQENSLALLLNKYKII